MLKEFKQWCIDNLIQIKEVGDYLFECNKEKYLLLNGDENGNLLDEDLHLIISTYEHNLLPQAKYIVYKFGSLFYYTPSNTYNQPRFLPFRYIGTASIVSELPFLGVHGAYELLNGSRWYSEWVKKAVFLQTPVLGICEKNTLAGIFVFQEECKKKDIKFILGETITIKDPEETFLECKCFILNKKGYENLLLINSEINVYNPSQYIEEKRLLELTEGLVCVINPTYFKFDEKKVKQFKTVFSQCYFQLDTSVYINNDTDHDILNNTEKFINNSSGLEPILISDAYYLDKQDYKIKTALNTISSTRQYQSRNQYFKLFEDQILILDPLFPESEFENVVGRSIDNLVEVCKSVDFSIRTGVFALPKYKMNREEIKFGSNEDLFFHLLEEGVIKKGIDKKNNFEKYIDRLELEIEVIKKGGFIDYFLILWDFQQYCDKNGILTGLGRGSAAGSLVAYVLNLTKVDPLQFGLLFERFLNAGRISSPPDIDSDYESSRREEIKRYMEKKYGEDKVCSIGTFTTFQLKAAFRDFSKLAGLEPSKIAYYSAFLKFDKEDEDGGGVHAPWHYLFKLSLKNPVLLDFLQTQPEIFETINLNYTAPKSASVHACATLILREDQSIYTSIPIRLGEVNGKKLLVSEWEGSHLEKAGYLKEDILGIQQLDKFSKILSLVKENYDITIDIYSLPYNEEGVFELFRKGLNGDVFHLGSKSLTKYCYQFKPDNIEDLIIILAIYRPGPIESNTHNEILLLRDGKKRPSYYPKTEEITSQTNSLIIYQEQIMQICQKVAGFSFIEADDIRKSMGKKNIDLLISYKEKWMEGSQKLSGYNSELSEELWDKMVRFAGYAFNKSHACCYAITGYICQYLKYKYPLPYWITALEFADDINLLRFISEINIFGKIRISPPDINRSEIRFIADFKKDNIVWSISRIKQCGEVAVKYILEEREKNGDFYSLEEFLSRVEKSKVNKSVVENLILAGAFDEVEGIKYPFQRKKLIDEYRRINEIRITPSLLEKDWYSIITNNPIKVAEDWWWQLQQKRVSGLAIFDYPSIISSRSDFSLDNYYNVNELINNDISNFNDIIVTTGGVISEYNFRDSKKGKWVKIKLEQNYDLISLTLWADDLLKFGITEDTLSNNPIIIFKGRLVYNDFLQSNALCSDDRSKIIFLE